MPPYHALKRNGRWMEYRSATPAHAAAEEERVPSARVPSTHTSVAAAMDTIVPVIESWPWSTISVVGHVHL